MTTQNASQQIDWERTVNHLIDGLRNALSTAIVTTVQPLAPACEVAGEEMSAETPEARAMVVFDELQRDVLAAVFAAAPNPVHLRTYMDYLMNFELRSREQAPAGVVDVLPAAPALTDSEFRVTWRVHPDKWFGR